MFGIDTSKAQGTETSPRRTYQVTKHEGTHQPAVLSLRHCLSVCARCSHFCGSPCGLFWFSLAALPFADGQLAVGERRRAARASSYQRHADPWQMLLACRGADLFGQHVCRVQRPELFIELDSWARTLSCIHRSATSKWRTLPSPYRWPCQRTNGGGCSC